MSTSEFTCGEMDDGLRGTDGERLVSPALFDSVLVTGASRLGADEAAAAASAAGVRSGFEPANRPPSPVR